MKRAYLSLFMKIPWRSVKVKFFREICAHVTAENICTSLTPSPRRVSTAGDKNRRHETREKTPSKPSPPPHSKFPLNTFDSRFFSLRKSLDESVKQTQFNLFLLLADDEKKVHEEKNK